VVALADGFRRPFARYWLSGFLADFGDGVRLAAFPLLAAQLTDSPGAVAAVTAVQGLPWLLVGAGLGVIVDRTDRRSLMLVVDITRAVIIAALAAAVLAHGAGLVLIYLTAFTTGAGSALRDTAAVTCVPRLVEPADLDRANGRVIAGHIVGNELAGPAAGGWLFGLAAVLPFAVNARTLGVAVLLLLTLPSVFQPVPVEPARRDRVSPLATLAMILVRAPGGCGSIPASGMSRSARASSAPWMPPGSLFSSCMSSRSCTKSPAPTGCCWPWPRSAASRPAASGPGLPGVLGRGGLCCSPGWSWQLLKLCSGSPPA
jgi:Major Facilitator Superfamily